MYGFLNRTEGVAVRHQRGSLTYEEFNRLIRLLSAWMAERGLEPQDRVAVVLPNSLEFLLCYYASLLGGFVIVPINERLTTTEVGAVVQRANPKYLITAPGSVDRFEGRGPFVDLPIHPLDGIERWLEADAEPSDSKGVEAPSGAPWPLDHPAILFFTSGSTGVPKGALYTHRTLVDNERIFREGHEITSDDHSVVCHCMAANFMFSQLTVPFLHVGGTVEIVDFGSIDQTLEAFERGATFICVIPWFGLQLVEEARSREVDFPSLRVCETGGDRVPLSFHQGFLEVFGMMPREMLGMTETNVFTVNPPSEDAIRVGSVGLPLPECEIEIRGPDGRVLPQGEEGEIWAWTPGRMAEYFEDPENTAETIVDGWVATGDAGYLDPDGYLWMSGRIKHIIICDGDNVHPGEVERVLAEHPGIEKVCVFGVPHEVRGETVAVAVVSNAMAPPISLPEVERFLESQLAETKIPKDLIIMDDLPETPGGKLDRRELVRLVQAQESG